MKAEEDDGRVEKEEVEDRVEFKFKSSGVASSKTRKALAGNSDFISTASSCYIPTYSNGETYDYYRLGLRSYLPLLSSRKTIQAPTTDR